MKDYLDTRLAEISTSKPNKPLQEVNKLKESTEISWNRQGNKIQDQFNSDIAEDLAQALWAIQYKKTEANEKIQNCNKLIKIADTSKGGWDMVKEYMANLCRRL